MYMHMLKNKISLIISIFLYIAANAQVNSFSLDCIIKGNQSGYIFLEYENKKDSCLIVNNRISFKGVIDNEVSSASFSIKNTNTNIPALYLENEKIELELNIEEIKDKGYTLFTILSVKGTKTFLIQKDFENFIEENKSHKNYNVLLLDKLEDVVDLNPRNPYLVSIVFRLSKNDSFNKNRLKDIYSKLDKENQNKFYLKNIDQNLNSEKYIKVNDLVFDINLPNAEDNLFTTKSLSGKWYLIDFWASWCSPCIKQFPELKRLYKLNKNKEFEIVGVSIDMDRGKWLDLLNKEKFDWINVIENDGLYGEIAKKYNINAVPTNFLVNPEGKIVARNISLENLEAKLKTLE